MLDHAFQPGAVGSLRLDHRLVMGSMHLGLETLDDDGAALAAFYAERARGGAALIVTGGSAISPEGVAGDAYSLINDERHGARLQRVAGAVHDEGGHIALQLFHAGRYAVMGPAGALAVAPSAIASRFSREPPRALTDEEVRKTIGDFAQGARRARELGYDAVEVMASEGYLINQFCSPLTNHRDDEWGGDAERRMRFGLAVLEAARDAVGADFPIVMRISGADLMDGSSTQAEVVEFARSLAAGSADAINVGIGWHESRVPTVQALVPPGTWVSYAAAVKSAVGELPVIVSNRIHQVEHADRVIASGACDFVSMARPFLADSALVAKARRGDARLINPCIACNQACIDRSLVDERVSCMVNPRAGFELGFEEHEHAEERTLGASPASTLLKIGSVESASTASTPASAPAPSSIERPPVPAPASTPTRASGGPPVRAVASRAAEMRFAVVGGGPAGLQAALELGERGHAVELFEAADELGGQFRLARRVPGKHEFGESVRSFTARLEAAGVELRLGRRLEESDAESLARFDAVVVATGVVPRRLDLPGVELPHVCSYAEAFDRLDSIGERVVIVGAGGIGVDLAHLLSQPAGAGDDVERFLATYGLSDAQPPEPLGGREITLLRRSGRIGASIGRTTRWALVDAITRAGVRSRTGVGYERIVEEGIWISEDGEEALIEADTIVIAAGQEPNDPLSAALERVGVPHRTVGGARRAAGADAVRAFAEGLRAAEDLVAELAVGAFSG